MVHDKRFTIGRLAKVVGVNPRTIRFYESVGLLPKPQRSESGYRLYEPPAAERIEFIQKAQSLGLTLRQTREILELGDRGNCPCGHVKKVLKSKIKELENKIHDFRYLKRRIVQAMAARRGPQDYKAKGAALCPTIDRVKKVHKKSS